MIRHIKTVLGRIAINTPLGLIPVRVRTGPARGARWTLAPFSAYWRAGGSEHDVAAALRLFPTLDGLVFWDIGAHFGIHTVGVAMQVGPSGQVAAFEPDPVAFGRLSRHVRMNRLANVRSHRAAASDASGTTTLCIPRGLGSAVSHLPFDPADAAGDTPSLAVPALRLDDLVAAGEIRPPDLIKVDAQGHGGDALRGAAETIRAALPVVAFSNHSPRELRQTRALLEPLGYRPRRFTGEAIAWEAIEEALLVPPRFL